MQACISIRFVEIASLIEIPLFNMSSRALGNDKHALQHLIDHPQQ